MAYEEYNPENSELDYNIYIREKKIADLNKTIEFLNTMASVREIKFNELVEENMKLKIEIEKCHANTRQLIECNKAYAESRKIINDQAENIRNLRNLIPPPPGPSSSSRRIVRMDPGQNKYSEQPAGFYG